MCTVNENQTENPKSVKQLESNRYCNPHELFFGDLIQVKRTEVSIPEIFIVIALKNKSCTRAIIKETVNRGKILPVLNDNSKVRTLSIDDDLLEEKQDGKTYILIRHNFKWKIMGENFYEIDVRILNS